MPERDEDVRIRCFLALDALRARYGDDLPYDGGLDQGFNYKGQRVPFLNRQKGIYRARIQAGPAALSIQTSFKGPYEDVETEEGFRYAYRAGDVDQPDNRALRHAFVLGAPLVYFVANRPGWYHAEYPCFISADNRTEQNVVVTPGRMVGTVEAPEAVPIATSVERQYAVRETRVRLHQGGSAHLCSRHTATAAPSAGSASCASSTRRTSSRTSTRRASRRFRTG